MANNTKKKEVAPVVTTRAEKKDATKNLIRELLAKKEYKHNELIDEVAKLYVQRFESEETDNINDVKGRVGSVLDIMKKDEDVSYDGGRYALKEQKTVAAVIETPVLTEEVKAEKSAKKGAKTTRAKKVLGKVLENIDDKNTADKKEETTVKEEKKAEKPAVKKTSRAKKTAVKEEKKQTEKPQEEEVLPLPPAPIQPIAPVAPITPEVAPEPIPEAAPTPKKRARKTKTVKEEVKGETPVLAAISSEGTPMPETKAEEVKKEPKKEKDTPMSALKEEKAEEKTLILEEKPQTETAMVVKEKKEVAPKNVVMDMSFLFGDVKPARKTEKPVLAVAEEKVQTETVKEAESKDVVSTEPSAEEKFETQSSKEAVKKAENPAQSGARKKVAVSPAKTLTVAKGQPKEQVKEQPKKEQKDNAQQAQATNRRVAERPAAKTLTADEKLREAYLKKLRSLGGDYFEYYSVYLLEKYSRRNGRRLEGLKITGGDHDGGIDGEIELTDKLGFRETIYIQSKNWNPDKGDERLWVVGETLLQQFIGACMCRQAKDGKQHCRGIFITTSRFTPDAKRILDDMSDKIVGYDGADLYEAAKECEFGVKYENGNWKLDEKLLSGTKAFFEML